MNNNRSKIRKVAIYCRVSSDAQREKQTIDSQISTLTDYASQQDYAYELYKDDGYSAETIQERPAFKQLLGDAQKQLFDGILVVEHNRVTRTDNDEEEGRILMILKQNNVRLISPHEGILDLNNPIFRLMAKFKFWASAEERAEIIRKTKRGKLEGLRKGKWTIGRIPFGYRYEKETAQWSFHPEESKLFLWVKEKLLKDSWSLRKIHKDLYDRGIKTKRGKQFAHCTLNYMLRNTAYKGELYANKTQPRHEWIKVKIPPLISEEEWQQIQEQLDANKRIGRPSKENLLLRGLLKCGHCQSSLYFQNGYYVCHNRRAPEHERTTKDKRRCKLPYIYTKQLDRMIFSQITRFLSEPAFLLDQMFSYESQSQQLKELLKKRDRLEWEMKRHEERRMRLIELFLDGNYDKNILDKKDQEIEQQLAATNTELRRVQSQIKEWRKGQAKRKRAEGLLKKIKKDRLGQYLNSKVSEIDFAAKRQLLETFFQSVDDKIWVFYNVEGHDYKVKGRRFLRLSLSWEGQFNAELIQHIAKEVKLGRSLKAALNMSEKRICLPHSKCHPFYLPQNCASPLIGTGFPVKRFSLC
ncbi:recombinase family protein [Acidobacteria bacterium AH-259-L09]|nr:recombinase family protein [Acidobacteria bacterium AH-259-L09]